MPDHKPSRPAFLKITVHLVEHCIAFLAGTPLVVVSLTILVQMRLSWRAILLLVMMVLTNWAISFYYTMRDINFSFNELVQFRVDFSELQLTQVPVSEFIEELKTRVPRLRSKEEEWILPFSARLQRDRFRILVPTMQQPSCGPFPLQRVTYASFLGVWTIFSATPERLSNLECFTLLHEIGHGAFESFMARGMSNVALRYMLLPSLFIALIIKPTGLEAAVLAVLAMAWYAAEAASRRMFRRHAGAYDEIMADRFALERCDPQWFEGYSVSRFLALMSQAELGPGPSEGEFRQRSEAFIENLKLVQNNEPTLSSRKFLPYGLSDVADYLLVAILVACGLMHAPLSARRLFVFGAATLLAFSAASCVSIWCGVMADLADHCFGVKTMTPQMLRLVERVLALRKRMRHRAGTQ